MGDVELARRWGAVPVRVERVALADVVLECLCAGDARPLVVCAHGFPDTAWSFRAQVGDLVDRGYRVVAPVMRGYAPSGVAASRRYDVAALGADLLGVTEHFARAGERVRLIGHDWGALAAYAATALAPERFSHVVTMAVPHPRVAGARFLRPAQARRSFYMARFQLRGVAEAQLRADDGAWIERLWREWSPGYVCEPEEMARVKAAILPRASEVLAYYRAIVSPRGLWGEGARLVMAKTRVPALYVHGVDDGCVGVELADGVERAYERGVRVVRVEGAGHFVHLERPEVVNREVGAFFG